MKFGRQKARFPKDLLDEAAKFPNGFVYEIDQRFDRDGAIPPYAIQRGWAVASDGKPTGEWEDNPNYGIRRPLKEVEQLLVDATVHAGEDVLTMLVANELVFQGQQVPFDVGITIVMDHVLGLGYAPGNEPWMHETNEGKTYTLHRMT